MYRIIIFLFAFLVACGSDKSSKVNVTDPDVPPVIEEPDPLELSVKYLVFQDGNQVKFFNGSSVVVKQNGASTYSGERAVTVVDKLLYMDSAGNISSQISLNITPDFCAVDLDGNVWTGEVIDPVTAEYLGVLPANYLKVYKNNIEYGDWRTRKYLCVSMFLCGSDIIAVSNTGVYYDISGTKTGINSASGFVVYDFDSTARTASINNISVNWLTNFFNTAKSWNGPYSWNGYKWDGSTLTENGTSLQVWRIRANYPISLPENCVVISAGSSVFNSETHYFFIECNSGWLFKYIPASDNLIQVVRLYTGDGMRTTGIYYSKTLNPVCGKDGLYFIFDGSLYRYRFDSGQIGFIDFCDGFLKEWN